MPKTIRQSDLEAYVDEALPADQMARVELALRKNPELVRRMSTIHARRDAGVHSLGEIWRRHRLSCPSREQLGSYLLDLMVRLDNLYFQYRQGFFPEDFFENVKQSIRMSQRVRSALGINVERLLLSQTFRDLVRSIDDSHGA